MPDITELAPTCRACAFGVHEDCPDLFTFGRFGVVACACPTCNPDRGS